MVHYHRDLLVLVLTYHQPTKNSGCICGGVALGESWAEHVADVFETAQGINQVKE